MKRIIIVIMLLGITITAQEDTFKVYKSGWYLGAGGIYPRFMTITEKSIASHNTHGFYARLGYDITEHFAFRLSPNYVRLHSFWYRGNEEVDNFTRMGAINIEGVYNILPCERVSPYVLAGYGITYFKSHMPYAGETRPNIRKAHVGYQAVIGAGAEFKLWNDLSVKAEIDYITASNNKIDGNDSFNNVKGILQSNGDTYMNVNLGVSWYFSRGERSKLCDAFSIREVIKEVPVEVEKIVIDTVYIDNIVEKAVIKRESFVIDKVRFKFDQDVLTNEAEIILNNVAKVMNRYPDEKFQIIGHTDSWGSDEYNLDLSKRRAESVKRFLIAKGVNEDRLFTDGCGERMPIADNNTKVGRAINRRIEFSIYDENRPKCVKDESDKLNEVNQEFENDEQESIAKSLLDGEKLSFTNVRFKHDSDELTDPSKEILDNVVKVLDKLTDLKFEIQGHTDSVGPEEYNQNLSERRATSVKNYLVSNGIAADRLTTIGFGESVPVATNGTREGKAKNRRIEFKPIK